MINKIGDRCLSSGLTLSIAESVTSGYLQFLFSQGIHASSYYQGGITVYNNNQKFKQLDISPVITSPNYAVTSLVAEQLAIRANHNFDTEIGLGITGFASKDKSSGIDDIYAFFAIAADQKIICSQKISSKLKSIDSNQKVFAYKSLYYLTHALETRNKTDNK